MEATDKKFDDWANEFDLYLKKCIGGQEEQNQTDRTNNILECICFELHRIANGLKK